MRRVRKSQSFLEENSKLDDISKVTCIILNPTSYPNSLLLNKHGEYSIPAGDIFDRWNNEGSLYYIDDGIQVTIHPIRTHELDAFKNGK